MVADGNDGLDPIKVLVAIGDRQRERLLVDAFERFDLTVADRCLDGPSLVERAAGPDAQVVLVSADLHGFSPGTLLALREHGLPMVVLDDHEGQAQPGVVSVRRGAAPEEIAAALLQAVRSGPSPLRSSGELPAGDANGSSGRLLVLTSGKGAPGKTTLAVGLAAALARVGRHVVLMDADLRGGNVVSHLDLDPRRGLLALTAGTNGTDDLAHIEDELQAGQGFAVLGGVERPGLSVSIREELLLAAAGSLRHRFDDVVVDAGSLPSKAEALLRAADKVLFVSGPDLISLWNTRVALREARERGLSFERVALVLNRREGREHYDAAEAERALGVPVLASIPEDRKAARAALHRQVPLTAAGGRAARRLQRLAEQLEAVPGEAIPTTRPRIAFWRRKEAVR